MPKAGASTRKKPKADETGPKTAYMHMIDPRAMGVLLPLRPGVPVDVTLPDAEVIDEFKPRPSDQCGTVRGLAMTAGQRVGVACLREPKAFEDGVIFGDTQYLPIVACDEGSYAEATRALATALAKYDRIVARPFDRGRAEKPIVRIGSILMEVYDDQGYCGHGHIGEDCMAWDIGDPEPEPAAEPEPEPEPTPEPPAEEPAIEVDAKSGDVVE